MQGRRRVLWLVAAGAAQVAIGLWPGAARGEAATAAPDLAALLAPDNPGEIQVVTVLPIPQIKGQQAVLYRWLGDQRWELVQRRANGTEVQGTERRGRWLHITGPVDGWVWEANTREVCSP